MIAYKCDGCGKYVDGEPVLTLDTFIHTYGDPFPKHFDTLQCVCVWAQNEVIGLNEEAVQPPAEP